MSRIKKLWYKFLSHLGLFSLAYWYGPFSRWYRKHFEKEYNQALPYKALTPDHVVSFYKSCSWVSDPLNGLIDTISKPEKFAKTRKGDCDEYAAYANAVLRYKSEILTISWMDPFQKGMKKFTGHNVCVFQNQGKMWHLSNWGLIGPFATLEEVIKDVVPGDCIPMAWSTRDTDLKYNKGGVLFN